MEFTSSRPPERENSPHPSPIASPHSNGSCCNSNGHPPPPPHPTPPVTPTPKPISRSHETNPYPTTFVQADTTSFKHVVQMLTGSSDAAAKRTDPPPYSSRGGIPPIKSSSAQKKQGFKLYERRNSLKNASLMIETLPPSPRKHEILSPSILDFPALVLSPVTPMNEDTLSKASAEERAIAEKKFYFHPSPRTAAARDGEPQLLPLFPVTSPRVSGSS